MKKIILGMFLVFIVLLLADAGVGLYHGGATWDNRVSDFGTMILYTGLFALEATFLGYWIKKVNFLWLGDYADPGIFAAVAFLVTAIPIIFFRIPLNPQKIETSLKLTERVAYVSCIGIFVTLLLLIHLGYRNDLKSKDEKSKKKDDGKKELSDAELGALVKKGVAAKLLVKKAKDLDAEIIAQLKEAGIDFGGGGPKPEPKKDDKDKDLPKDAPK